MKLFFNLIVSGILLSNAICGTSANSEINKNKKNNFFSALEKALNQPTDKDIKQIFTSTEYLKFKEKRDLIAGDFFNIKWKIINGNEISNNEKNIKLSIKAEKSQSGQTFKLESFQELILEMDENIISSYKIINETSIIKSENSPLKVILNTPNTVLTGEQYYVDIILENPLENDFLAGGLAISEYKKKDNIKKDNIELNPLVAGGIFKTLRAPQKPLDQSLEAILIHPKGIISIRKMIKVISEHTI